MKKIITLLLLTSTGAYAMSDCANPPTCEDVGYICSEKQCEGLNMLNCPFDSSKKICYPSEVKCEVGSILYNDFKCYNADCGKTPIGVVYDTDNRLAIQILPSKGHVWNEDKVEVTGLEKCTVSAEAKTTCGTNGKQNTKKIVEFASANNMSFPAAEYCYNSTLGNLPIGSFWLPSVKEAALMAPAYTTITDVFAKRGMTLISGNRYVWSSTEKDADYIHFVRIPDGATWLNGHYSAKTLNQSVVCIIGY